MLTADTVSVVRGQKLVVSDISLQLKQGETVGIVGPNGSGKTSFLLSLNRILSIASGRVVVCDKDIKQLSRRQIAHNIATVLQEKEHVMPLTVYDVVALGRLPSTGILQYGSDTDEALVLAALQRVALAEFSGRLITELSGGEQQRVMIARAIAQQATFLLLDEPTNHLDLRHQLSLVSLLKSLKSGNVIVLHDLNLAAQCCDKILLMNKGNLVAFGTPAEVLDAELLSEVYQVNVTRIEHAGRPHLIFDPFEHAG